MSLGAFAAGVVLSESEYRHELQADIEPFEGLLLGFFFMSVGMSADLALAWREPANILLGVVGAARGEDRGGLRAGPPAGAGERHGRALRPRHPARQRVRLRAVRRGGGGRTRWTRRRSARATLVIALSMLLSPILFAQSERWLMPRLAPARKPIDIEEVKDAGPAPVVICGFGRFGQIVGRILRARGSPSTRWTPSRRSIATLAPLRPARSTTATPPGWTCCAPRASRPPRCS